MSESKSEALRALGEYLVRRNGVIQEYLSKDKFWIDVSYLAYLYRQHNSLRTLEIIDFMANSNIINWEETINAILIQATGQEDLASAWIHVGDKTKTKIVGAFWQKVSEIQEAAAKEAAEEKAKREHQEKERAARLLNLEKLFGGRQEMNESDVVDVFLANANLGFDLDKKNDYKDELDSWFSELAEKKIVGYLAKPTPRNRNPDEGSSTRMVLLQIKGKANPALKSLNETVHSIKAQRGRGSRTASGEEHE